MFWWVTEKITESHQTSSKWYFFHHYIIFCHIENTTILLLLDRTMRIKLNWIECCVVYSCSVHCISVFLSLYLSSRDVDGVCIAWLFSRITPARTKNLFRITSPVIVRCFFYIFFDITQFYRIFIYTLFSAREEGQKFNYFLFFWCYVVKNKNNNNMKMMSNMLPKKVPCYVKLFHQRSLTQFLVIFSPVTLFIALNLANCSVNSKEKEVKWRFCELHSQANAMQCALRVEENLSYTKWKNILCIYICGLCCMHLKILKD